MKSDYPSPLITLATALRALHAMGDTMDRIVLSSAIEADDGRPTIEEIRNYRFENPTSSLSAAMNICWREPVVILDIAALKTLGVQFK